MLTLKATSALAGNRPNGFNYLRIILAIFIIGWHSVSVCYGSEIESLYFLPVRPLVIFFVPSFFAMSGFLIAGSLFRTQHLPTFLTLRALRIFPALCCEVFISAFVIGAALTTLPLSDYFHNPEFRHYLRNIVGDIHYFLPGVFQHNQNSTVNSQLWTIPLELKCYIAISLLYIVTLHKRPRTFLAVVCLSTLALTGFDMTSAAGALSFQPRGQFVVLAYLWGIAIFMLRDRIRHDKYCFVLAIAFAWAMLSRRELEDLATPAIAYVTIYLGMIDYRKNVLLKAVDLSYGLYLYGYVIQQTVYQLMPNHRTWAENFIVSLLISGILGLVSWVFIESRIFAQRDHVIAVVTALTDKIWVSRARREKRKASPGTV